MKFLYMVLVNCKRYFKDYKRIAVIFIIPIAAVLLVKVISNPNESQNLNIKVAVVNLDNGQLGNKLVEKIKAPSVYDNKEKGLEALKNYDIIALYEIPENFTEEINGNKKPIINSYKLEEGNTTQIFEAQIEQKINELYKIEILKKNNIISDGNELNKNVVKLKYNMEKSIVPAADFLGIIMIIFYLFSSSSNISMDLLGLRQGKILERFLCTSNRGYAIIGSIYLSMIITETIVYTSAFVVMKVLFKLNFVNFEVLVLNIVLMSMVSISLAIMINRIFKNPGTTSMIITLISLIMLFLYVGGSIAETSTKVPKIVLTLSKFTPLYWSLSSIEKSVLFPNVFVLILIALVFFSAGSIKYSNFAKESK